MTVQTDLEPGVLPGEGETAAVVIGASGGIGKALSSELLARPEHDTLVAFARSAEQPIDITDEGSVARAAASLKDRGLVPRLIVVASGFLHGGGQMPEKTMRKIDADHMARSFAVNAIGPALVMKHFLPLLPRKGRSVLAVISAKVGSIGDNRLGGWYSYRASKAAVNQLVRTASIEAARRTPDAICVAIHPGTVDTKLSQPFARTGLRVQTPQGAARRILDTLEALPKEATGGFYSYSGDELPW